jgi:hypothetical protein
MSRSGYSDDGDFDNWSLICYRGALAKVISGKKGQAFLKEMLAALDAMPEKRLIAEELVVNGDGTDSVGRPAAIVGADELVSLHAMGDVCALGAVGKVRALDMSKVDPHDPPSVAHLFDINEKLASEIAYVNDEGGIGRRVPLPNVRQGDWDCFMYKYLPETPEQRFIRVRKWVAEQIWDWKEID